MIKVLLTGGLGNQMFQYAFGKTLAVKNNTQLVLSTAYLQSKLPFKKYATPMEFKLGVFNIQASIESNLFSGKILYPLAKTEYLIRDKINEIKLHVVNETVFSFQADLLNTSDQSYIKGNFQSQKYFQSIASLLRDEFVLVKPLDVRNLEWKYKIENCNAVSVHIRRGDYINLKKNAQKFTQLPVNYYQKAVQHISEKIENPVFFVFSDDMNWVKENLDLNFPYHNIENNTSSAASHIDMHLMSLCKHNIICNSTFSWWSAWLNTNTNKIVIAPQDWFADVSINSQDIIPDDWIKL